MSIQELFHPFIGTDVKAFWTSYTSPRMGYECTDIPGVDFYAEFLVAIKPGYMDIPHIHDGADNYFIFCGTKLDDIFNSEFEVTMFMGDSPTEMEMYKITKPSIVRVPAGVWHCPVYYNKINRGTTTILWYGGITTGRVYPKIDENGNESVIYETDNWTRQCVMDESKLCTYCGKCFDQSEEDVERYMKPFLEKAVSTQKYKDCIYELNRDCHTLGDAVISPRATFNGPADMAGTQRQFSFNIITEPCVLGDKDPHNNGQAVEFLWFSGADTYDPWGSFDAEIEVMIGEDPENMEKIIIDKPGVISVPPGVWKGEINVKRADKPICFIPWYQHTDKRYKITSKTVDGEKLLIYNDARTIADPTAGDELYMQMKK